jgi:8-oxo-dGTP pyrophosphatase MutT (NUDIX family)
MDFHRIRKIIQTEHTLHEDEWKGAVVFLCNDKDVFFIKRSNDMPTHSGQIAFIGGHKNPLETDPWSVAQREFEEETSLSRSHIQFLGYLPVVMTANLKPIVPVMAELSLSSKDFLEKIRTNGEWDDCIAYPWSKLMIESSWQFAWRKGLTHMPVLFHPMNKATLMSKRLNFEGDTLWGATASIVWDFLRLYYEFQES